MLLKRPDIGPPTKTLLNVHTRQDKNPFMRSITVETERYTYYELNAFLFPSPLVGSWWVKHREVYERKKTEKKGLFIEDFLEKCPRKTCKIVAVTITSRGEKTIVK